MYAGVVPFITLQVVTLGIVLAFPILVTLAAERDAADAIA